MAAEVLASLCALGLQIPAAGQVSIFFPPQLASNFPPSFSLFSLTLTNKLSRFFL
jgi:hypothetical protein